MTSGYGDHEVCNLSSNAEIFVRVISLYNQANMTFRTVEKLGGNHIGCLFHCFTCSYMFEDAVPTVLMQNSKALSIGEDPCLPQP